MRDLENIISTYLAIHPCSSEIHCFEKSKYQFHTFGSGWPFSFLTSTRQKFSLQDWNQSKVIVYIGKRMWNCLYCGNLEVACFPVCMNLFN